MKTKKRQGFTLIEMLVVVLIIVLLAGLVFRMVGAIGKGNDIAATRATIEKVSHAPVKGAFLRAVIDGKIDADRGDLHIAHQSVLPHIQKRIIALCGFYKGVLRVRLFGDRHKRLVVFLRFGAGFVQRCCVHLLDGLCVLRLNKTAVFLG